MNDQLQQLAKERESRRKRSNTEDVKKSAKRRKSNSEFIDLTEEPDDDELKKQYHSNKQSSSSINQDEAFARQLQQQEAQKYQSNHSKQSSPSSSINQDEAFARQLQQQEAQKYQSNHSKQSSSSSSSSSFNSSSSGTYHRTHNPTTFRNPIQLYINSIPDKNTNLPVVHFSDITSGKPLEFLFTAGMLGVNAEIAFMDAFLPPTCSIVYIGPALQEYPPQLVSRPTITYVAAPMDIRGTYATGKGPKDTSNPRGCCHSKLNLIRYATHLRVMITSSNPQMGEWHGAVGQIVWCCDMPKRGRTLSTSSNSSKPHSFANDLSKYLEKMFDNKHPHLYQKWQQYIVSEYDFNVCGNKTHLVCSMPGIHTSQPIKKDVYGSDIAPNVPLMCGLRRVHHILRTKLPKHYFVPTNRNKSSTKNSTSSHSDSSTRPGSGDSIEATCSSVSNYTYGIHGNLMKACEGWDGMGWDQLRFIFPSQQQAQTTMDRRGLGVLTCDGNSYKANTKITTNNPPMRGCEKNCMKTKCGINKTQECKVCLIHKYQNNKEQCRAGRQGIVQHTKMLLRESTRQGETYGKGWIYAGSHNLSTSAWGSVDLLERKKPKEGVNKTNRVNHWEIGIMLTDIQISDYKNVIPWDRDTNMDALRYDNSKDKPFRRHNNR